MEGIIRKGTTGNEKSQGDFTDNNLRK